MPRPRKSSRSVAPGLLAARHADRKRLAPERTDVGGRVSRPARNALVPDVSQDQDGRLAADAFGVAVHETVEDEIAGDHEAAAGKRVDQGQEALPRNLERHSRGL